MRFHVKFNPCNNAIISPTSREVLMGLDFRSRMCLDELFQNLDIDKYAIVHADIVKRQALHFP